jgi:protein-disulfide isomerase
MMRVVLVLAGLLMAAPAFAEMPGVNVTKLSTEEVGDLELMMKQGACPCDPKLSLFECIEKKSCPAATGLANFGADKMRAGLGAEQTMKAVVKKYINDHVPPAVFDVSKTPFKGAKDGKIVLVEFADFECPRCGAVRSILAEVVKAFPNDVKLYFKQFPIAFHQHADAAARAALAAHLQGRFWPMHDLIFQNQSKLTAESFDGFAAELGLNIQRFKADMASPAIAKQVQSDRDEGMKSGLSGTPTVFINGRMYVDDVTVDALKAHIAGLLKK